MKILIIRFSSIGDLTQALSLPAHIKSYVADAEVHFVTRDDLSEILQNNPHIKKIWTLKRSDGFSGLLKLARQLNAEGFTHIYDAHNNLRSFIIRHMVAAKYKLTKPMFRFKRFLLLNFHINHFEKPFSGQRDLLKPLEKWGFKFRLPPAPQLFVSDQARKQSSDLLQDNLNFTVIVPSAAYELKRWPVDYWLKLVQKNPQKKFVVLAGKNDHFTTAFDSEPNVLNLTGKTDLMTSAAIIEKARNVVTNDTGLLHFAEQLGKKTIALMGPAPFGFPSRTSTLILQRDLPCRPCSKHGQGPCRNNKYYHECLRSISVDEVSQHLTQMGQETP